MYKKIALEIAREHTVYTIDLPGFGDSNTLKLNRMPLIECLTDYVEQYLLEKHFDLIIAHSLGAAIVLRILARTKKHLGIKIILCDPAYLEIAFLKRISNQTWLFTALFKMQSKLPKVLARPFIKLAALLTINKYSLIDDILVEDARKANAAVASGLLRELCNSRWRFSAEQKCGCEISILYGEKDRLISKQNIQTLQKDIDCRLVTIPNIGHTPVVESFDFMLGYIREELK
jgi:pimeloyl-ACP methyl ester carboxylesterase